MKTTKLERLYVEGSSHDKVFVRRRTSLWRFSLKSHAVLKRNLCFSLNLKYQVSHPYKVTVVFIDCSSFKEHTLKCVKMQIVIRRKLQCVPLNAEPTMIIAVSELMGNKLVTTQNIASHVSRWVSSYVGHSVYSFTQE
jgi:hypothetical protein